jgi:adenylate cyclase
MATLARWARSFGLTRAICILLLLALVPLRIANPPPLEELRLRTFDLYQTLRPREAGLRPVVIVDIDEASLKEIGQWPWPRTIVADLVTRLAELGVVAIGFDVIFAEPDRMSPSIAAQSFRNLDDNIRDKLRNLPSNDEVLAEAISPLLGIVPQRESPEDLYQVSMQGNGRRAEHLLRLETPAPNCPVVCLPN